MVDAQMHNEITVREALAGVGLFDRPGESAVLMTADPVRNVLASEFADRDVQGFSALYHASGLFRPFGIQRGQGRRQENLARVVWLTLDCDLKDWLNFPSGRSERDEALARMWAAPHAEIDDEVRSLRATLETILSDLGLPLHRLDYTGYGVCGYLYLAEEDQPRIDTARQAHKEIIARINEQAGQALVDVQSSDAGTRVTRVPGSLNRKGAIARTVTTLVPYTGETWRLTLEAPKRAALATPSAIPHSGAGMAPEDVRKIVDGLTPHWAAGQKHDIALAFAGMLAKAMIPEEQALAIVAHLAAADAKPWDRASCVRTTYARARAGFTTGGYMHLQKIVPGATLDFIAGVLNRYRTATAPRVTVGGDAKTRVTNVANLADEASVSRAIGDESLINKREREVISLVPNPPASAFYGVIADYRDIVKDTTEAADALHLGAVLTVISAMIGRRVGARFGSDDIYPMLFTVLVGATGWSRKETAMKRAMNDLIQPLPGSLDILIPGFYEINDITSAEGLAEVMAKNPNTMIRLAELTVLLSNMKRKGTENLTDKLINLWDAPKMFEIIRRANSTRVEYPALSMLGATQPGRLATAMTEEHILSGFANRIVFVAGAPKKAMAEPSSVNRKDMYALYQGIHRSIASYHQGALLPRSAATKRRWDEWYMEIREKTGDDEETEAMRARHQMIALKIALIFAVTDGAKEIEVKHLDPAIAFIEWMWRNLMVLMRSWGVSNWTQISNRIEDVLCKQGPMKRHPLSRYCANRKWNIRDFAIVLDALIKTESIVVDTGGVLAWANSGTGGDERGQVGDTLGTTS